MSKNTKYCLAEYVWIDGDGGYRCKTRVFHTETPPPLEKLPEWNYDGSSTKQAPGTDSEVIIKPCAVYWDPFRGDNNILVLTDTYDPNGKPIPTNTRAPAAAIFAQKTELEPWFGIEQEYTLFKDGTPLGWPKSSARSFGGPTTQIGFPAPQGPYYCGAGADVAFGRPMIEKHLKYCLEAGLNVSGINAEVMPGQWEYQVGGPGSVGISCADDMVMSRYILNRVGEEFGIVADLDPKPIPGDWNGAGCHTNFSTKPMREQDGAVDSIMIPMMDKLEARHKEHIAAYGEGNERRLTGKHETQNMEKFSWGVANRGASIRIGNETKQKGKGYFEDRRPASNMDPYVVSSMIYQTCCLMD